eukprot:TRINITY_DN4573_c0_g1_i1.p1 TRINITY_DN4573_c0_g1~~TRINITY_DN4573_c0_g1_i1.p1  ORF type:complete len:513 (-),score=100.10 TRINITY_DN4573_c0_g1_i1:47-1585(-)
MMRLAIANIISVGGGLIHAADGLAVQRSQTSSMEANETDSASEHQEPTVFSTKGHGWAMWPIWSSQKRSNDSGRVKYVKEKLDFDRMALASLPQIDLMGTSNVEDFPTVQPKVAFLFMLMSDVDWPSVWDNFFDGAPPFTFSIYIHMADTEVVEGHRRKASKKKLKPLNRWGAVNVGNVKTEWCALVGVEVALISAALEDPQNKQLVFLSHDTIPLKAFSYVYSELVVDSPDTSKFCFAEKALHKTLMMEAITNEMERECFFRDFYSSVNSRTLKHHQWVVLSREHGVTTVKYARQALEKWGTAWRKAAPDIANMAEGCSDEAVPGTALLMDVDARNASTGNALKDLEKIGVTQQCLTLVQWHNCFRGTELELPDGEQMNRAEEATFLYRHIHELFRFLKPGDYDWLESPLKRDTNEFPHSFEKTTMAYLKLAVQHGFMFARKFPRGLEVLDEKGKRRSFPEVLPALWDTVDEAVARQRIWTRNGFSGKPKMPKQKKSKRRYLAWLSRRSRS